MKSQSPQIELLDKGIGAKPPVVQVRRQDKSSLLRSTSKDTSSPFESMHMRYIAHMMGHREKAHSAQFKSEEM